MTNELTYTVVGRNHASAAFKEVANDAHKMGLAAKTASGLLHAAGTATRVAGQVAKAAAIGIGAVTVAAGAMALKVGKDSVKAASDLNETFSKSNTIFGKSAAGMNEWANAASWSFGMTKEAALGGAAQFGNFFNQIGIGSKRSAEMSKSLVKLSADLGSFNNADPAEVMNAFQSATRGEYDSLQKFIPTIKAATVETEALRQTHKKKAKDLTEAEKAQALYSLAIKDAGKAQGDFARTSGGLANQQRILKAQFSDVKGIIGTGMLPGFASLAQMMTKTVMPEVKLLAMEYGPRLGEMMTRLAGFIQQKAIPAGKEFAQQYGPKIRTAIGDIPERIKKLMDAFKGGGGNGNAGQFKELGTNLKALGPALKDFKEAMPSINDALKVSNVVVGFFARHVDTLKKWMPAIVAAFIAWKVAQVAQTAALALSLPIRLAELATTRAHSAAMKANSAALAASSGATTANTAAATGNVAATNAGILATVRARIAGMASTVWLGIQSAATWAATAATTAFAFATSAAALPITLIILAIAALAAGVIYCYNKFPAFKAVVDNVFKAIAAVGLWLWNNILKPTFNALAAAFGWVVTQIKAYWTNVLQPVFRAVGAIAMWLWNNVLKGVFASIDIGWTLLVAGIKALWNNVLRPTWDAIAAGARWLWANAISPAINNIRTGWSVVMAGLRAVWTSVLKPTFDAIGTAVGKVRTTFTTAVNGIKAVWDRLKDIAKAPIKFVIDNVLNGGLIAGWNWISKNALGGKYGIEPIKLPGFADGGVLPGYSPGKDIHLAALSGGEAVMRPEWTKVIGEQRIMRWNKLAKLGGIEAVRKEMGIPGFADGGIFGTLKSAASSIVNTGANLVKGAADFLSDPGGYVTKMMSSSLGKLNQITGSNIGQQAAEAARIVVGHVIDAAKSLVFANAGVGGGGPANLGGPGGNSVAAILAMAKRFYPGAIVSSGVRNTNDLHGRGLAADLIGGGASGMAQMARGFYGISGRLLELIHSGGGGFFVKNGARVGANYYRSVIGQHYNHVHVAANRSAMYDNGGWLMPGTTLAQNYTGRPERVSPPGGEVETMSAPIVIQLDSQSVYTGLLRLRRRLGGSWELA